MNFCFLVGYTHEHLANHTLLTEPAISRLSSRNSESSQQNSSPENDEKEDEDGDGGEGEEGTAMPPRRALISCSKWSRTTAVRWYGWKPSQGSTMSHWEVCSAARLHMFTLLGKDGQPVSFGVADGCMRDLPKEREKEGGLFTSRL